MFQHFFVEVVNLLSKCRVIGRGWRSHQGPHRLHGQSVLGVSPSILISLLTPWSTVIGILSWGVIDACGTL